MKINIGIVGPEDSVRRIMYVVKEFKDVHFQPFIYEKLEDMDAIFLTYKATVDQWLFSGVLNYSYAIDKNLVTDEIATYPPLHGSSFFGTLLESQLAANTVYQKIGIDTIADEEIEKVLSFYNLKSMNYINSPFKGYQYVNELVDFHKEHFEKGNIEVIITSIKSTYLALKKAGIPVFRVTPSYLAIRLSIELLIERAQVKRYRNAQMAVVGFKVDFNLGKEDDALYYSFRMKHNELDLKRTLLHLSEKMNGSLMQLGDGLFFIFTTRGEVHQETEAEIVSLIKGMKLQLNIGIDVAIGYGESVSQAEQHVRYGFRNRKQHQNAPILIVDEDQNMTLIHEEQSQSMAYRTVELDQKWQSAIKDSGISPGVVSKIEAYATQYNREAFSSQDIARWLQSTERNGRRILAGLERGGLVEQCGESQSGERGRPRKIYRFK
ncbi:hypothetical protein [Virgibacillus sp. MG-45]|uniref:hypothetical protein n=1 Tax=Virgibacillus sp. MG-45 TaxID=3102791 RepID=UPI002ED94891